MRMPTVGVVHDATFTAFADAMPFPVHDDQAVDPTDPTLPYAVIEWPAGGGPVGSAVQTAAMWEIPVRVRSVAIDADAAAGPATATRQAAQWAADVARAFLLDVRGDLSGDGWAVTGRAYVAGSGQMRDGTAVVVVDDYMLTITA